MKLFASIKRLSITRFLFVGALIIGASSFFIEEKVIEINYHDTYFIATSKQLVYMHFLFIAFLGLSYLIIKRLRRKMVRSIQIAHTLITLIGSGAIYCIAYTTIEFDLRMSSSIYFYGIENEKTMIIQLICMLIIIIQPIHIINLMVAVLRKKRLRIHN